MSADVLLKAADLMRERASDAYSAVDDGDWRFDALGWNDVRGTVYTVENDTMPVCDAVLEEPAIHIASWHPGMGMLVARLLEAEAEHVASHDCEAHCEPDGCDRVHRAVAVARAYLGTP